MSIEPNNIMDHLINNREKEQPTTLLRKNPIIK